VQSGFGSFRRILDSGSIEPMKFVRGSYFLFLFSLALGLFCGELPESFSLADDVSNDFVEVSFVPILEHVQIARGRVPSERRIALAVPSVRNLQYLPAIEPVLLSSPDLLRLLSIQRK
jgi:hypothetical protein